VNEHDIARNAAAIDDPRVPERVWRRIKVSDADCWIWTGVLHYAGYGRMSSPSDRNKTVQTHRFVYECLLGPIPDGLELDHLCRVRACCNPLHLEPVTHRENILRGHTVTASNAAKTHCPSGHPYAGENLQTNAKGYRKCRQCQRDAKDRARINGGEEWRARKRQQDAEYKARKRAKS
jgi:hypothetical protein